MLVDTRKIWNFEQAVEILDLRIEAGYKEISLKTEFGTALVNVTESTNRNDVTRFYKYFQWDKAPINNCTEPVIRRNTFTCYIEIVRLKDSVMQRLTILQAMSHMLLDFVDGSNTVTEAAADMVAYSWQRDVSTSFIGVDTTQYDAAEYMARHCAIMKNNTVLFGRKYSMADPYIIKMYREMITSAKTNLDEIKDKFAMKVENLNTLDVLRYNNPFYFSVLVVAWNQMGIGNIGEDDPRSRIATEVIEESKELYTVPKFIRKWLNPSEK